MSSGSLGNGIKWSEGFIDSWLFTCLLLCVRYLWIPRFPTWTSSGCFFQENPGKHRKGFLQNIFLPAFKMGFDWIICYLVIRLLEVRTSEVIRRSQSTEAKCLLFQSVLSFFLIHKISPPSSQLYMDMLCEMRSGTGALLTAFLPGILWLWGTQSENPWYVPLPSEEYRCYTSHLRLH